MAYSYQIVPALDLVRALIKANLTTQGETPTQIPLATTTAQAAFFADEEEDLPLTVIQVKTATTDDLGTSDLITLPLVIHHVRRLETNGVGTETAMARLAALAAGFKNDYRLRGVATVEGLTGADVPINRACPERLLVGEDSELQQMLDMNEQGISLVAASLELRIDWYEGE